MFKGNRKYYFILAIVFIGVVLLQYTQPKPINWSKTYLQKDKIPFGCYAIYNLLEDNFANKVVLNQQTIYDINNQTSDSLNTLILINDKLELNKLDLQSLFKFIKKGNTVFIASNHYQNVLQDTFNIETQYNWGVINGALDSILLRPSFEIKYVVPENNVKESYVYPQVANESYFTSFDTALFKISSINKQHKPVLIEAKIGNGKLLLSSLPDVFGNLFIVNHNNRYYAYTLLSKIKNNTIIWDEYYKTYNVKQKGLFQFIFSNNSLYMGYMILIVGLLIFMIFEMKRRQRPIAIVNPLQNSTLEFIDVISHVYFKSNNHKYIAEETVQYFYFFIREKFNVNTNELTEESYNIISKLSGVDVTEIKKLFSYCQNLKQAPGLSENDLQELNNRINNFKQKSIR